jgi:hypothetical protein
MREPNMSISVTVIENSVIEEDCNWKAIRFDQDTNGGNMSIW